MTLNQYFIILQVTHAVPLTFAAIRYRYIEANYRPFILLLLLGFINETINFISIKLFKTNSISYNIFNIIDFLLLLYQFRVWGFFRSKTFYYAIATAAIISWTAENLLYSSLTVLNPYFRIFYAFAIELMIANRLIYVVNEKTMLSRNATFLICVGLIIVYMYQIIFEGALISEETLGETSKLIIRAMGYTDVLVQLLYSWAFLVAPVSNTLLWDQKIKAPD